MFKRLNVRNARKAREEEMGLDSEMKEVLGLNDTDSDESSSSSSDSEASVNAEPVDSEMERDEDDASVVSELRAGSEVSGDDVILVSMEDAVGKPLYEVGNQTLCIFCDGKTMRSSNTTMIQTHLTSQAHTRRSKRFERYIKEHAGDEDGLGTNDPRKLVRQIDADARDKVAKEETMKKDLIKEKKRVSKERRKSKKAARAKISKDSTSPAKNLEVVGTDAEKHTDTSERSSSKHRKLKPVGESQIPEKQAKFLKHKASLKATDQINKKAKEQLGNRKPHIKKLTNKRAKLTKSTA